MYVLQEFPTESNRRRLGPGLIGILANASLILLLTFGIGVAPKQNVVRVEPLEYVTIPSRPRETPPIRNVADEITVAPVYVPTPEAPRLSVEPESGTALSIPTIDRIDTDRGGSVVSPAITAARILVHSQPQYPIASIRTHEEGTVMLQVLVGVDGKVSDVRIGTSSGFRRLDEAAMKEVRSWRFAPATSGGQSIAAWVNVPVKFELH